MVSRYSCILAAVDEGPTRRCVVSRAFEIARECGAGLVLAHVVDFGIGMADVCGIDFELIGRQAVECLNQDLEDLLLRIRSDDRIPFCDTEVRIGQVSSTLMSVSSELDADLVVCGSRNLSGLGRTFSKGVSQSLVRNLECDVLIVRCD